MANDYQPLNTEVQPSHPPSYDDINHENEIDGDYSNLANTAPLNIEQFEIEDVYEENSNIHSGANSPANLFRKASLITKKLASNFNNKIIYPVTQMIDPIYEGYQHFNGLYERYILKLGNPLVVKRLLYVTFIMSVIYVVTRYSNDSSVSHPTGSGFAGGMFFDINKLSNSIPSMIDINLLKENLEYFSSMPHISGTMGDLTYAKYIEQYMKNNGIKEIDFNTVLVNLNFPNTDTSETYVKLRDDSFSADLDQQKGVEYSAYNPNALSTNGEISGIYYYANYGEAEDFQKLKDEGINLKDSILLISYGGNYPESNKVKMASDLGVQAVVFVNEQYKDINGKIHEDIIEKYNVGLERHSPGDVLTPGWSLGSGFVSRLSWFKSETTPKIPTIPISYKDGLKFIQRLNGGVKFSKDFRSGDSSNKEEIKLKISNVDVPTHQIWNLIGSIAGREQSDKGLIIGSQRDSSCYGATTNTGSVVMLELIKIFTALQRKYHWVPSRSIYFVSFDGTEYNLAGLTEWVQHKKDALIKQGFTYLDLNDVVSGEQLEISSHPFLHGLIRDVLKKVKINDEDNDNKNFYDLYKEQHQGNDEISYNMIELKNYIPFINLLNTPSFEIKFSSKNQDYPTKSCFNNFKNFEEFKIDPEMKKLKKAVEILSRVCLELVEKPILPFDFADLGASLDKYVNQLEGIVRKASEKSKSDNVVFHFEKIRFAVQKVILSAKRLKDWNSNWQQYISESGGIEPNFLAISRWKQNENYIQFSLRFLRKELQDIRPGYANLLFGIAFLGQQKDVEHNGKEYNIFPSILGWLEAGEFGRAQYEVNFLAEVMDFAAEEMLRL